MENLPLYISIIMMASTLLTVLFFYKATGNSKTALVILFAWLGLQTLIGRSGFYTDTSTMPPKFLLCILPPLICIVILFSTSKGRQLIDSLDAKTLTILHTVRIPVEITLFFLFANKAIPQVMTFEGHNFDIFSGLTAPFIYYFGFIKKTLSKKLILVWNFVCLALLINIVVTAVLAAPFRFQQLAFDQPNIAILYFPFVWLPCCIVPLVLLSHLTILRQLLVKETKGVIKNTLAEVSVN